MHRVGLANQPTSVHRDDGLELVDTRVLAAVRCAPPQNKPTPEERDTCAPWLDAELRLVLPSLRVVVALGAFGWQAALTALARVGAEVPVPRPRFGHGAEVDAPAARPGRAAARQLPPEPAEHVHRAADRGDAGRRAGPRRRCQTARVSDTHFYAVTVVGRDRPGIIAETTNRLAGLGLNLEDSTMTLLRGHFAMMLVCSGAAEEADIESALASLTIDRSLLVTVARDPGRAGAAVRRDAVGAHRPRRRPHRASCRRSSPRWPR